MFLRTQGLVRVRYTATPVRLVADLAICPECALFVHRGSPMTQPYTSLQFTRRSDDFYFGRKFLNFITSNLRLAASQAPSLGTPSPFGYQLALDHPSRRHSGGARRRRFEIRHFGGFHYLASRRLTLWAVKETTPTCGFAYSNCGCCAEDAGAVWNAVDGVIAKTSDVGDPRAHPPTKFDFAPSARANIFPT